MNPQALSVVEPVLFQSNAGLFVSKRRMVFARVELTGTRIVVYKKSAVWTMFGLIGLLIAMKLPGKRALELEYAAIAKVARGKYGFNKKILDVTMQDGATHRLSIDHFDEVAARLRDLLGAAVPFAA
jgi:hypothetical protein